MSAAYCEPLISGVSAFCGAAHKADGLARSVTVLNYIEGPVVPSFAALCFDSSTLQSHKLLALFLLADAWFA